MSKFVQDVTEFYDACSPHLIADKPDHIPPARLLERFDFLYEEFDEYCDAISPAAPNFIEQVDGLIDLMYIAIGTLLEMGVPIDDVWDEIHASNMRKFPGGKAVFKDGKLQKPADWVGPDLATIIYS